MANIDSLKQSISELSEKESIRLILTIRDERREALNRSKTKKKSSSKKSKKRKKTPKKLAQDLTKDQAAALLAELKRRQENDD